MRVRIAGRIAAGAMALLPFTLTAHAHHAMGGMAPASFLHGFLSGIGHPVLGADHFAYILGIGLMAAVGGFGLALPALFIAAMVAGLGVHLAGVSIPYADLLLALSVLVIGLTIARGAERRLPWVAAGLFAIAGVLHGFAFAESVIGAEPTPIFAYVVGLALMQMSIAAVAWHIARLQPGTGPLMSPVSVRAVGMAIAAVGAVFLALNSGIIA